jgi:hypothetical protein
MDNTHFHYTINCFLYWNKNSIDTIFMKRKFKQWWSTIPSISTEQWPLTLTHWTQNKNYDIWHYKTKDRYKNVAVLNWLMESKTSNLDNWISNKPICFLKSQVVGNLCQFNLNKLNTCLLRPQKLVPRRLGLGGFHCINKCWETWTFI